MAWKCKYCGHVVPGINPFFVQVCPVCGEDKNTQADVAPSIVSPPKQSEEIQAESATSVAKKNPPETTFATELDHELQRDVLTLLLYMSKSPKDPQLPVYAQTLAKRLGNRLVDVVDRHNHWKQNYGIEPISCEGERYVQEIKNILLTASGGNPFTASYHPVREGLLLPPVESFIFLITTAHNFAPIAAVTPAAYGNPLLFTLGVVAFQLNDKDEERIRRRIDRIS